MAAQDELLAKQVSKLEDRFDNHASKMEERLDQIVDLMKTVTQLQERDVHQAQDITRLESTVESIRIANDETLKILFAKFDSSLSMYNEQEKISYKKHDEIYTQIRDNKASFDAFINKGQGVRSALIIVFAALQLIAIGVMTALYDNHKDNVAQLELMNKRVESLERGKPLPLDPYGRESKR